MKKIICLLIVVLYCIAFRWAYTNWLYVYWDYFGFVYSAPPLHYQILAWLFCILPVLWLPVSLKRVSTIICWYIYALVYIPIFISLLYIRHYTDLMQYETYGSVFLGFGIIGLSQYLKIPNLRSITFKARLFTWSLCSLSIILLIILVVFYRNNLHLVGFNEIYDLRTASDELIGNNGYINYIVMLLGSILLPFFIAFGLVKRNIYIIIFGFAGEVILYSTNGSKQYILSLLFLLFNYFLSKNFRKNFAFIFFGILTCIITILMSIHIFASADIAEIMFVINSIVLLRTFAIEGLLTSQYLEFFSTHPYTYYSHINIISKLGIYPYKDLSIGQVIGEHFSGNSALNANANFWAMDGIAALGPFGIIFISIICLALFLVIDIVFKKHSLAFGATMISMLVLNLLNASIFTTLLSGGGLLLILLMVLAPAIHTKKIS